MIQFPVTNETEVPIIFDPHINPFALACCECGTTSMAILTLSSVVCVIIIFPLMFRERTGEKFLPWTHGEASHQTSSLQIDNWYKILHSLWSVFKLHTSFTFAICLYIIPSNPAVMLHTENTRAYSVSVQPAPWMVNTGSNESIRPIPI